MLSVRRKKTCAAIGLAARSDANVVPAGSVSTPTCQKRTAAPVSGAAVHGERSEVLEVRLALGHEGGHAFFLILQSECRVEDPPFE